MLVLSRKKDESILIGDDIEVFIVEIGEDRVRLGVRAPKEMKVFRKELLEEIRKENAASTTTDLDITKLPGIIKK